MKVILLQDVKKLGKKDDIVEVAEGYARNFLFAKKLAVSATKENVNSVTQSKSAASHREQRNRDEAKLLASQLDKAGVRIAAKAGEGGRLFGTITSMDIANALKEQYGIDIDKKKIDIKEPIRNTGSYTVTVKLYADAVANVAITVTEQ